jgi:hypothetical protein
VNKARRFARLLSILAAVIREPGLSPARLAARAGVSERTVGARLAQARQRLVRDLGPAYGRLPTPPLPGVALGDGGDA